MKLSLLTRNKFALFDKPDFVLVEIWFLRN